MKKLSAESLAEICSARPWTTIGVWAVVLLISFTGIAMLLGSALSTNDQFLSDIDSKVANNMLEERLRGPERVKEMVIVESPSLTVEDPGFQKRVETLYGELMGLGGGVIEYGTNYYQLRDESLVSADRRTTLIPLTMAGSVDEANNNIERVLDVVYAPDNDFRVMVSGGASTGHDFQEIANRDMGRAEVFGVIPALGILIVVFGSIIAAIVPVVISFFAIIIAIGITSVVGQFSLMTFFVVNMITMMGLAVGIDYALFVVSRYREERSHGADKLTAIATSGATAGRAVAFSGMTVILALLGLLVIPTSIFRSLGAGAIFVVFVSILAALTLLPAVLSLLGDRINSLRLPFVQRHTADDPTARKGFWVRSTNLVMRHPVLSIIITVGFLVAAASPYFDINTGSASGLATMPDSARSKRGFQVLEERFAYGMVMPVEVVIDGRIDSPEVQDAIRDLNGRLESNPVLSPASVTVNPAGDLALLTIIASGDPYGDEVVGAVRELRKSHIPASFSGVDANVKVTGITAENIDYFDITDDYRPIVFALVLGLSFILLTVVFHSLVVPLKAIIMNLLSVGAAYGILVLVFQKGVGAGLLGFQQSTTIEAWVPIFLFSVLFGLSMDYHVFLLSRIREHYLLTGDNRESVAFGIQSTARIITGAALIMVAVFAGFAAGELVMFQQVGFGLAVAVFLDATIVRSVLVPAAMQLLGKRNWYLPKALGWLPDFHVEGANRVSISRKQI